MKNVAMAKAVKKYPEANEISAVKEYAVPYGAGGNAANLFNIIRWLGFPASAAKKMVSSFDFINLGISGVTKGAVNTLASHLGISRKYISENIFDISVKTFERKEDKAKLDKKISSHALEIARVVQHAYEVFRDEEKVKRWLNTQNKALNNFKPVALFDTLTGLNMVNDILGRIEEGVYS
jgi:putative toxin-antitoxin system antitoxin component (TIGR02293 family)